MKTYRRIEITAFRNRIIIMSRSLPERSANETADADPIESAEPIEIGSAEGRRILAEAISILHQQIGGLE